MKLVDELRNEAADRAAKEAAGHSSNAQLSPEPQPEQGAIRTGMAIYRLASREALQFERARVGNQRSTVEVSSHSGLDPGRGS